MLVVKTTSPATSPSPEKLQPSNAAPSSRTSVALLRPWLRTYSKLCSRHVVYRLAANYSAHYPTRQGPSPIRGVGGTADQGAPIHHPLLRKVHERQVRRPTNPERTTFPNPPAWRAAHGLHETRQREPAAENQIGVERGEGRFVAEKARRGLLHRQLLLLRGMRRVIRGHEVQDAVPQGRLDAVAVVIGPERGVDPVEPVQRRNQIVRQREVMRRGVRGYVGSASEKSYQRCRESGGDVGYVDLRPSLRRQDEGRRGGRVFRACRRSGQAGEGSGDAIVYDTGGERVVFAVQDHR